MKTRRNRTAGGPDPDRRRRGRDVPAWADEDPEGGRGQPGPGGPERPAPGRGGAEQRSPGRPEQTHPRGSGEGPGPDQPEVIAPAGTPVAFRTSGGWRVGEEEVSDLTSAMVLADLLAADLPASGGPPPSAAGGGQPEEELDPRKLQETVAQLEHALRVRVRVEQAIGVLAERHRLRPRQAFELLRSAARIRGRRVLEVAGEVVDSATNPLLRIPEELAKPPVSRRRGRLTRHSLSND